MYKIISHPQAVPADIQTIRDVLRAAAQCDFTPVMTQVMGSRRLPDLEDLREEEQIIERFQATPDLIVHFESQDGDTEGWIRFRAANGRDTVAEGSTSGRFSRVISGFID